MRESWDDFARRFGTPEGDQREFIEPPRFVRTGIRTLDATLSGGLSEGVHVLMAQPGAGKSALSLTIAMRAAREGCKVLYASVEMTRQQCLARCCSAIAHTTAGLEDFYWSGWERMGWDARRRVEQYPHLLEDGHELELCEFLSREPAIVAMRELGASCPGLAIADGREVASADALVSTTRDGKAAGLDLLVVDYLQSLEPPSGSEDSEQTTQISRTAEALRDLAKELRLPILAISSMNRSGMRSDDVSMSSAYGSNKIEFGAVSVMQLTKSDIGESNGWTPVRLHVVKNRRGPDTGDDPILLWFDKRHNLFQEAEQAKGVVSDA